MIDEVTDAARRRKIPFRILLILLSISLVGGAFADEPSFDSVKSAADGTVRLTARGVDGVAPGASFKLVVEVELDRGWHIYGSKLNPDLGIPTQFSVTDPAPFQADGELQESKPHERFDSVMEGTMIEHEKEATFSLPFKVPNTVKPGLYTVGASFVLQACDAMMCLPPETLSLEFKVRVTESSGDKSSATKDEALSFVQELGGGEEMPVVVRGKGVEGVSLGGAFEIVVEAEIDRGWHIYSLFISRDLGVPTQLTPLEAAPFVVAGGAKEPKPHARKDEATGETYLEHEGTVQFRLPFTVPSDVAAGAYSVRVSFITQLCDAMMCLNPEEFVFDIPVIVGGSAASGQTSTSTSSSAASVEENSGPIFFTARFDRTQVREGEEVTIEFEGEVVEEKKRIPAIEKDISKQGLWGIILLSASGALIALLTPCVYPMIPITISVFTKQAHQKRSAVVGLAFLFCFGVMASFTTLGLVLSAVLGENGANFMATNPVVNFAIGALFIYFAFSLFGYYDIQLPAFLRNRVASSGQGGGVVSVLVMGFVFSVTTFTCVGPIAAALLALAAGAGPGYAAIGMLAFSGTFALPFFFLALFPKALTGLPRSGGWLSTVKGILGFVELLAAWKFLSATIGRTGLDVVISREVIYGIWGVTLLLMTLYLFGKVRFPHDPPLRKIGAGRVLLAMVFLICAAFCFWAITGKRLNANLESQLLVKSFYKSEGNLDWRVLQVPEDPAEPLVLYKDEIQKIRDQVAAGGSKKPIFINFTGHV